MEERILKENRLLAVKLGLESIDHICKMAQEEIRRDKEQKKAG
jgi:hypothetical protein